jgi:NAD(P)-dependent dehydrogenase (short-subunit alcohol dehydrogenase family)
MDVSQLLNFSGRVVAVTGASQGIGEGIARRFAEAGASVLVHYRSGEEQANAVVKQIADSGGEAIAYGGDLSEKSGGIRLVEAAVSQYGGLDVLVNNAGIFPNAALNEMPLDDWQTMFSANVETAFLCTQAAANHMKDNGGGVIVNLGSISGIHPGPDHCHYNSAKAAVIMFTRSASQELAPLGIRVNSVSPGLIARPGIEEQWPDGVARWQSQAPLKRMGHPTDIADACLFLGSPASSWITGHDLVVDGGVLNSRIY